jgi:hypothetical protein
VIGVYFVAGGILALVGRKRIVKNSRDLIDRLRRIHMGAPNWVYEFSLVLVGIVSIPVGIALIVVSVLS